MEKMENGIQVQDSPHMGAASAALMIGYDVWCTMVISRDEQIIQVLESSETSIWNIQSCLEDLLLAEYRERTKQTLLIMDIFTAFFTLMKSEPWAILN